MGGVFPCFRVSPASAEFFPYKTRTEILENGLKVIFVPMNSGGLAAYWTIVRTGARDEYEPGHTGFAHFFEHMMFHGSKKYSRVKRETMLTKMGADGNAFTSDDLTGYYLNIASEDLQQVIELEADRFKNLSYAEADFKTEAGAVFGEYRKNRLSPFFTIYEAVHDAAFDKHTYGHTAMGYVEDIEAMPEMYEYSRSFFSRYYRPENCVVLVAGDIDPEETLHWIKKNYGDWKPGYVPPLVPTEPEQSTEKRLDVPYKGQARPIVWMAYKIDAFDPVNRTLCAADLFCELAFGETSDIHKKLVLQEQVVEFINSGTNLNRDPGLLDIITRVKDPEKVEYVIAEIDRTIASFQDHLCDLEDLDALQSRLKYDFLMGLDTPQNVARQLVRIIAVTGGMEALETLYGTYDTVTPQDIRNTAKHYMTRNHRTVAILRGGKS